MQNPSNPQDWDRFAYVHNSPIINNDPTGHYCGNENAVSDEPNACPGEGGPVSLSWYSSSAGIASEDNIGPSGEGANGSSETSSGNGEVPPNGSNGNNDNSSDDNSCSNCQASDPYLLRGKGAIAARQHVDPSLVGQDGVSAWCISCSGVNGKFWGRTISELRDFAQSIGLDPNKAVVYTPQFGGEGHYSLFIDAIDEKGYIMPDYAQQIDAFLRNGKPFIQ